MKQTSLISPNRTNLPVSNIRDKGVSIDTPFLTLADIGYEVHGDDPLRKISVRGETRDIIGTPCPSCGKVCPNDVYCINCGTMREGSRK